jgi:hypothetical protein
MGFIIDNIRVRELVDQAETVNVDWTSPSFSLDDREAEFSVAVYYENGSSVNMVLSLQVSADNINFADITESFQAITDDSGSHIWDIAGSGAPYARVKVTVLGGSIDVTRILYTGKQRH